MNEQTLDQLKKLKLYGMHHSFKNALESQTLNSLTADELIGMLIQSEVDDRNNRTLQRGLLNARFRYKASIEDLDFGTERALDKNLVYRLSECTYISKSENVLITGSTGTGKSYLSCALGNQACILGKKVFYANANRLFTQLKMAKADGSIIKEMAKIERQDLVILDDFGIQPIDAQSRMILMEIIEDRHGKKSTMITSQLPVDAWYEAIGDATLADAIMDRVVHDAHRINLKGESLRRKRKLTE